MSRLGVYVAAGPNPIFLRLFLLQFLRQTRLPNVLSIYENGNKVPAFEWVAQDIIPRLQEKGVEILYKFCPDVPNSVMRYVEPLKDLYFHEPGVDVFLKMDLDDFYHDTYVQNMETILSEHDFVANISSDILLVRPFHGDFKFQRSVVMKHSPIGGAPTHVVFNRRFAERYVSTMAHSYHRNDINDDELMAECAKTVKSARIEGPVDYTYVSHGTNYTSWGWQSTNGKVYLD